jgi:O-antigen/teichoic acid export membrane protein
MSLAKKTAHAMLWVTLISIFTKTLGFATQIVLARLLAPADFGLLAIGLLAINTMGIFRDLGFGATLIYKKDDSDHTAANTAFILLPLVASTLFLIAYFSASYIAIFFDNTAVEPIVQILALTFVISSFGTVPSMLLEKELEFKKKVLPETVPIIGYACVTIWLAINGYGVWSLVYGQIVSALLTAGLIWLVSDWRPTFKFDRKIARDLFGYGKHIMGASIVLFLITNIDDAIVGRVLGIEALGFYTLAYTISNLPATQITHLVGRVMFPLYSKLQDNRNALGNAYLKTLKYVSMLSIPAAFGIFVIAPDFVSVLLGEKWMPAVPALQVLCLYGLFRSIAATTGSVFQAIGKPEILFKTGLLQLVLMMILMLPLITRFGIVGMSLAIVIPLFVITTIQLYVIHTLLKINKNDIFKMFCLPLLGSFVMAFFFKIANIILLEHSNENQIINLIILVLTSSCVYIGTIYLLNKNVLYELKNITS